MWVNGSGSILDVISYDAFGNIASESSAGFSRYMYTCREFDITIGLQYNRARYYSPEMMRWISEDPLRFIAGDSNLYRYVKNCPTRFIDPWGLVADPAVAQAKSIISARIAALNPAHVVQGVVRAAMPPEWGMNWLSFQVTLSSVIGGNLPHIDFEGNTRYDIVYWHTNANNVITSGQVFDIAYREDRVAIRKAENDLAKASLLLEAWGSRIQIGSRWNLLGTMGIQRVGKRTLVWALDERVWGGDWGDVPGKAGGTHGLIIYWWIERKCKEDEDKNVKQQNQNQQVQQPPIGQPQMQQPPNSTGGSGFFNNWGTNLAAAAATIAAASRTIGNIGGAMINSAAKVVFIVDPNSYAPPEFGSPPQVY